MKVFNFGVITKFFSNAHQNKRSRIFHKLLSGLVIAWFFTNQSYGYNNLISVSILNINASNTTHASSELLSDVKTTVASYRNKQLELTGICEITITDSVNPLQGSTLNCTSNDIWLYFPNIKPSTFNSRYRTAIQINGAVSVVGQNIRIEQYLRGTMVITQPSTYKPLQVYSGENKNGSSLQLSSNSYNRSAELGSMNNAIRSFHLKRGYMATFAQNDDGTGKSRVYVADDKDLEIKQMPSWLVDNVSFVRVLPWRWTGKKGWSGGSKLSSELLNCHWHYDWDNVATSNDNIEYVPMRHNMNWNAYANINNKAKSTHALGFNEPDRPDQANLSVDAALAAWPEMMKSGLRVGAPVPSDAGAGLTWLYSFMQKCDSLNYRVDFVPVHWYKGGQTARQFYDWLRGVHLRTRRPVWITEWNNGANWTSAASGKPTYEQQAAKIKEMIFMLDTAQFVERYSIYEWVEDTRQMFYSKTDSLTPAGKVYRDEKSQMAYNSQVAQYMYLPCVPTPIVPYFKVDGGSWQNTTIAYVQAGLSVTFGPHPWSGGSWSWSGPGGFTSTAREITISNIQNAKTGKYIVTHTNSNRCKSTDTFTITFDTPVYVTNRVTATKSHMSILSGSIVKLTVTQNSPVIVSLFDLKGTMLYRHVFTNSSTVPLAKLVANGTYIIHIQENRKMVIKYYCSCVVR